MMKLLQSLYGLQQSPRKWFGTLGKNLEEIGFTPLKSDPCVTIYSSGTDSTILTLYIDHVLLLGSDIGVFKMLRGKRTGRFAINDMADVSRVLGMLVSRDRANGILKTKSVLLEKYGMAE